MRVGLRGKLLLLLTVTLAALGLGSGLLLAERDRVRWGGRDEAFARELGDLVQSSVSGHLERLARDRDYLQRICVFLGQLEGVRWVEVFDVEGRVVAHTLSNRVGQPPLEGHTQHVRNLLASDAGPIDETDASRGRFNRFFAVRVGDETASVVELVLDLSLPSERREQLLSALTASAGESVRKNLEDAQRDAADLQRICEALARREEIRQIEVFDTNGTVVAHSLRDRVGSPPLPAHQDAILAALLGQPSLLREGHEVIEFLPVRRPNGGDSKVEGAIELAVDLGPTLRELEEEAGERFLANGVVMLLGVLALYVGLTRLILRRIPTLTAAAERVGRGDLSVRVEEGTDELGQLATSFNTMTATLARTTADRRHLEDVQNALPLALLISDRAGKVVATNHAACSLTKRTQQELLGEALDAVLQRTSESEGSLTRPGDEQIPVSVSRASLRAGRGAEELWLAEDLRPRLALEQELRLKDQAMALSLTGLAMTDLGGRITYANRAFLDLFGFEEELEVLGLLNAELDTNPAHVEETINAAIREQGHWVGEVTSRRTDGSAVRVHVAASLVKDPDGRPLAMLGCFLDVDERWRREEERKRLLAELEAKNAELERFTYTVSHDLKSPLITIKGFLGLLERDFADTEQRVSHLARLNRAADKMTSLLDTLLELSRSGKPIGDPQPVPLGELVRVARDALAVSLEQAGILLEVAPDLPAVRGDPVRLAEVLQNLLENAIKFRRDGTEARIEVGAQCDGDMCEVFVHDNGIGVAADYHETVFGLFDKLDAESSGSGAGLALSRQIVEAHGGRIWIESDGPGQGTTVRFTLPLERGQA